ncbi:PhoX family protein [Desulfosporosinus lacus]|uniref:DUF839 domain-containing protein n=1 Tax=Desulfosporosinus lacus DSM 15449 TaxID=1121420 RepID=A0A1M5REA0_9FIRM|nr:alkaline phosphatase PhoX [Desulfosporosinus lacus]SHH24528.1 hypothetical protein SAMN02746098_00535 [Desulfosporosinus lacus DSM 15449]
MEQDKNKLTRRSFLAYMGLGTASMAAMSVGFGTLAEKAEAAEKSNDLFNGSTNMFSAKFNPIQPSDMDELVLPSGFKYDVVAAYGDQINEKGDTFGFNPASPCFFPLNDAPVNDSNVHGILWVNHESGSSVWVEGTKQSGHYATDQVNKLLYNMGGTLLEVSRDKSGVWHMVGNSTYARRITGLDRFEFTGPARGAKAVGGAAIVQGTLANAAAGKTLWGTVLSCERHFEDTCRVAGFNSTHYGWIVEVDPFDSTFKLRKHTSLGRLHHGNAAMGLSKDGKVVVYTGDDVSGGCIYKFISKGEFDPEKGKANSELLTEGALYAADMAKGEWIPLIIDKVKACLNDYQFKLPDTLKQTREVLLGMYNEPADIYVYPREAALILGATPTVRPADIKIHPSDNSLFIAHTNDYSKGSLHGHIVRCIEEDGDLGAIRFEFEFFTAGGRQVGFSSPGKLSLDDNGNIWVQSDISSDRIGKGAWAKFKNNGMYLVGKAYPVSGGVPQFASAPREAEFSGSWITPDEGTLFLTVQHPGEQTEVAANPTSMWPHRPGDSGPRPALVAITGQ